MTTESANSAESAVRDQFDEAVAGLGALSDEAQVRVAGEFSELLGGVRLGAAARIGEADWRRTKEALADERRPVRAVTRDARRAQTMARNPRLARGVADGSIPADTIDHLRGAADEAGVVPEELVDEVSGLAPDQARRVVTAWVEAAKSADEVDELHDEQMQARRVRRGRSMTDDGVPIGVLSLEGPDAVLDRIYERLCRAADAAYEAAGGRDTPAEEHVPWAHRMFDTAAGWLLGEAGGPAGGGRPSVVVTIGLDDLGVESAVQVGSGPIGSDVFADYVADGDVSAMVVGADGQPLWFGRSRRRASTAQFLALAVRDRGCVLCGAAVSRCEAHHLVPWESPARGGTDIDNLALLCQGCHRDLHARAHTLIRRGQRAGRTVWATRPATEAERPPPRPVQRE